MTHTIVRTDRLTRRFGAAIAVEALSFEVREGELFGIVGPDGAGKTTLLRMLAGVLTPTDGAAWIGDVEVTHDPESARPLFAYMSQRFGLYEDLTVRENIDFYADLYLVPAAERVQRIERLYAFSRLGPFEDRLAGALSGGMKQKLSLCCALIHDPSVLLLDEPTFGVDPISRRDLWIILHERVAAGTTVIVTTSYMDEAERCDRVALLDGGRLLAVDAPAQLQSRLPGELLAVRTGNPRAARDRLRSTPEVRRASLFGDTVHVLLRPGSDEASARRVLDAAGIPIHDIATIRPSLEDVFLDFVAGD